MKKVLSPGLKTLKAKMLATVSAGVVMLFIVILLNNSYSMRLIEDRLEKTLENMSALSNEYIELRTNKSRNIAGEIAGNPEVVTLASPYIAESDSYKTLSEIKDSVLGLVMYLSGSNEEIDSIYLYYESRKTLINSDSGTSKTNDPGALAWADANTGWEMSGLWKDYYSEMEGRSYISMMYRLDYLNQEIRTPVYLGVNFDKRAMFDFLAKIKLTENASTALVSFKDNVYILEAAFETVVDLKTKLRDKAEELESGANVRLNIQGIGKSIIKYLPLNSGNGGIIHIIPESDMRPYTQNLQPIILIAAALLSFTFLFILYMLIDTEVDKPTKKLIRHMKNLEAGRFSDKIDEKRNDEFGRVFDAYNNMTVEIEKLIQELYQEKLVKKEMELKILQEKINPHFLYNTLDTINWIAKENQVEDISRMVIALSTMYRKTFNRGRDLISIDDVMSSIACYLDIQQIRYGESFDYEINCDPDTRHLEILNLIIQTLVENAIVHGMEGKKGDGRIMISTCRKGDLLQIEVFDNGAGMSEDKLSLIRASINSPGMDSESGLRNVQKRINLYYGSQYGIKIDSSWETGTRVTVVVPAVEASDD
ncbi:MAG: sensor histidine kinase [Clostridia bacterium]|nr:sensor histidine kinase [Clostridia bacterium]